MKTSSLTKLLLGLAALLSIASIVTVFLYTTDLAFSVWEHLSNAPLLVRIGYGITAFLVGSSVVWLLFKLFRPAPERQKRQINSETDLLEYIDELEAQGIDTDSALKELHTLNQRKQAGKIHIALCGDISTGKSSLVKALLPDHDILTSPAGGSTRKITEYQWTSPAGDQLIIADLPGLNEASGNLDPLTLEESARSHVVIFVVDGDLTRDQYKVLKNLLALNKPLILALNKTDQLDEQEKALLREQLKKRLPEQQNIKIALISAGGEEEVIQVDAQGREQRVTRPRKPDVGELTQALQQILDNDPDTLHQLRDAAVFTLAQTKLEQEALAFRKQKADEIIKNYSRRAMLGAMAAVTPGSDIVIQGVISYKMVTALAENYKVPVKSINIDRFLELASKHVTRTIPLVLAVTGNILKVFPGAGTLAGGVVHAIAYGLILESLGKAVSDTLAARGDLPLQPALKLYEEKLGENLESRAKQLAVYAIKQVGNKDKD